MVSKATIIEQLRQTDREAETTQMSQLNQIAKESSPFSQYGLAEAKREFFCANPSYNSKNDDHPLMNKILQSDHDPVASIDLLEALIYLIDHEADAHKLAAAIIGRFKTVGRALAAAPKEMLRVPEVTDKLARMLKAIHFTLSFVLKEPLTQRQSIPSAAALIDYLGLSMRHQKVESLRILFLDKRNGLLCDQEMHRGTVDHTPLYPREIVSSALHEGASGILMAHNHPSGDPTPSPMDIQMTRHVQKALNVMGIDLHDHIIIGSESYFSMRAEGCMDSNRNPL